MHSILLAKDYIYKYIIQFYNTKYIIINSSLFKISNIWFIIKENIIQGAIDFSTQIVGSVYVMQVNLRYIRACFRNRFYVLKIVLQYLLHAPHLGCGMETLLS